MLLALATLTGVGYVLGHNLHELSHGVAGGVITALLSAICHFLFETTVWPADATQWGAVVCLGLLPVGAAFYTWDYGVKHGDIMVLGAASYASPLLSTLVLVTAGFAAFTWPVMAACLLITLGAVIAAKDMLFKRAGPAT